jgi:hypothetical protein
LFGFLINFIKLYEYNYETDFHQLYFPILFNQFFNFNYIYAYLNLINVVFSNFFLLFLQIIIDILLFFSIKITFKTKLRLLKIDQGTYLSLKMLNKSAFINNAEKNVKLMILCSGVILFILHSPDVIISIFMATIYNCKYGLCIKNFPSWHDLNFFSFVLSSVSDCLYAFSFSIHFFIFIFFNKNFRKSFKNFFLK